MAYVHFSTPEAAAAAIQASKEKSLKMDGATVVVAPYLTYQQRVKCQEESFTNLYVKNLPSNVLTNEDLINMFNSYGNITSARLVKVGRQPVPITSHDVVGSGAEGHTPPCRIQRLIDTMDL